MIPDELLAELEDVLSSVLLYLPLLAASAACVLGVTRVPLLDELLAGAVELVVGNASVLGVTLGLLLSNSLVLVDAAGKTGKLPDDWLLGIELVVVLCEVLPRGVRERRRRTRPKNVVDFLCIESSISPACSRVK